MNKHHLDFHQIFRSLRHRNFRLFVYGQSVSLIGTWMQLVAVSWLVYRLTNSAWLLGVAGFVVQIPSFVLAPVAGVVADRYDRRKVLLMVQVLSLVQAVVMAVLVFTGTVTVWHVLVLGFFLGVVNAFDLPVRQSLISEMVNSRADLNNAIALNSSMFNGSRLVGPAIAGIVIALFGEGVCFLLNAFSFFPIIAALMLMKIPPRKFSEPGDRPALKDLQEGFRYAAGFMPIKTLLLILGVVSFMGGAIQTLMPVFVKDVYHGGPKALGFVVAMSGIGALLGSLYLAGRRTVIGLGKIIGASAVIFSVLFAGFGFITDIRLAGVAVFFIGLAMILGIGSTNIVLQNIVEEDKRGRIMSLYGAALIGMTPLGSLVAGALTDHLGLSVTLAFGGVVCLAASMLYWRSYPYFRTQVRSVYFKKGIIPFAPGD